MSKISAPIEQLNNIWKKRFITLCLVIVVIFVGGIVYLYTPIPEAEIVLTEKVPNEEESSEFVVRTTKKNLNSLVNAYLDKLLSGTKHHYYVSLEDDVQLFGELPIFSTTVPLFINFEPIVQENGDIILKQKSISVGQLQLPNKKIMKYIDKYLPMPEWVIVNAKEEEIYVKITDMNIKSNFKVSVNQFDLEANDLAFKINVPYKTLGIDPVRDTE